MDTPVPVGTKSEFSQPALPRVVTLVKATRAETDEELLRSWLASLNSPHTRRNFETTARRFLVELPMGLRRATVEDVRDALAGVTAGLAEASARQYVLRVKSLLGYANELGYTPFNAGVTIKVRSDAAHRGASLAKRIITEAEVGLLVRGAPSRRDRILLKVTYAGGLRVSEVVGLTWSDVQQRAAPGPLARGRKPIASIAARERWRQRSGVCEPKGWRKAYRAYSLSIGIQIRPTIGAR